MLFVLCKKYIDKVYYMKYIIYINNIYKYC